MTDQEKNKYSIFVWKPENGSRINFGDALFPMICEKIVGQKVVEKKDLNQNKLIPGGSTIHFASEGDVVWGAGIRDENHIYNFNNIDVRAVRGPLSRDFLIKFKGIEVPEIYGDPALLLPELFPEIKHKPVEGRIGIVPHYREVDYVNELISQNNFEEDLFVIDPLDEPMKVVEKILSCDFVISSSLHGIIVAEAYKIPVRWLRFDNISQPAFKYTDYFASTGRQILPAQNIKQAIKMGEHEKPEHLDTDKLLKSFPADLNFEFE